MIRRQIVPVVAGRTQGSVRRVMGAALILGCSLLAMLPPAPAADTEQGTQAYAAAVALHNRELYDLAADEWARFVKDFPTHSRAPYGHYYLGICRYKTDDFGPAEASFQKVLADHPNFDQKEGAMYFLGLSQFAAGKQAVEKREALLGKAADTFARLAEQFPRGKYAATAVYHRGDCYYHLQKHKDAIANYAYVVKNFPNDPIVAEALYAKGVAEDEQRDVAAAGATYGEFLKKFPQHALATEVGMRLGETLFQRQQYSDAERWFAAAAAAPDFKLADHALMRQAASLSVRNRPAEAAALYLSVVQKFPESRHRNAAQLEAGRAWFQAGELAKAQEALEAVRAGDDADKAQAADAKNLIARCLLKEGRPQEALEVAEAATPLAAGTALAVPLQLARADALYELADRRKEAVAVYADVARQHPQDSQAPQALYMAAFASLNVGDYAAAIDFARRFNEQYAKDRLAADVAYVAAECRLQLKEYPAAVADFAALQKNYPQRPEAEHWLVRQGLASHLDRKHRETIDLLQPRLGQIKTTDLQAEAHYLIGVSQKELQEIPAAVKSLERSLEISSAWRQADDALLALAVCYRQTGDLPSAVERLRQIVKDYPRSRLHENAHYLLGECAYDGGDFHAAVQEYQLVINGWPQGLLAPYARLGLGWALLGLNEPAKAEAELSPLADDADQPLAVRARYPRGMARQQQKKFAPAAEDLKTFLESKPEAIERGDARFALGLCQTGLEQWSAASATFAELLKTDPDYVGADKARFELAWALKEQGQDEAAVPVFAELAEKHPDSPLAAQALFHVAEHSYGQEKYDEATRQYYAAETKAAALHKAGRLDAAQSLQVGENAAHKLGWAYYRQKDFANAEKTFAYQLRTYPQGALREDARFMLGESHFEQGKWEAAQEAYRELKTPSKPEFAALASLHSANAANRLKNYEQALKLVEEFEQRHAGSDYLPEALYERGWALHELERLDEAIKVCEEVTAQTNREVAAKARFLIGEIYFAKKDHKEAVRNFFKTAFGYGYPVWQANAHFEAARCFEVLGNKEQAVKSYREVVEKHPDSDKALLARDRLRALGG